MGVTVAADVVARQLAHLVEDLFGELLDVLRDGVAGVLLRRGVAERLQQHLLLRVVQDRNPPEVERKKDNSLLNKQKIMNTHSSIPLLSSAWK